MRTTTVQCLFLAVFALVLSVEAQLSVSSDSILILHGSTSELIITYTEPTADRLWFLESDEDFRGDIPLIRVPIVQTTEEIYNVPEDIGLATNNEISGEQPMITNASKTEDIVLEPAIVKNATLTEDIGLATDNESFGEQAIIKNATKTESIGLATDKEISGEQAITTNTTKIRPAEQERKQSNELNPVYDNNTLLNSNTPENTKSNEPKDDSDEQIQMNLAGNTKELSEEMKRASEKIAEEINSLKVEANVLASGKSFTSKYLMQTEFKNKSTSFTTSTPVNDIAVYNTSLETNTKSSEATLKSSFEVTKTSSLEAEIASLERNPSFKEDFGNRKKRNLDTSSLSIEATDPPKRIITVSVNSDYALTVSRNLLEVNESLHVQSWRVALYGWHPGNIIMLIRLEPPDPRVSDLVIHVDVERAHFWSVASSIIGWIYFVGWGLSAQFQFIENWKRKSVIGLNFDYLGYNMIGHSLYGIYNFVLYSSRSVQEQFFLRYPLSANPIQINDVVFSVHNSLVTLFTIVQCFYYERGNQKVSRVALLLFTIYGTWIFFAGFLAVLHRIYWLDFINQCAFVKFTITFIKYAPQAYMNFRRKSTVGWSIGAILLDFTGGLFSLIQMIILAYNFNDWASFETDTTKLGLAFFTLLFDILFMVQHYILYADNNKKRVPWKTEPYKNEDTRPNSCYVNPVLYSKES